MRTSGKNESGNRFSVIGFIRGYSLGIATCKGVVLGHSHLHHRKHINPYQTSQIQNRSISPSLSLLGRVMISLLFPEGWGWHFGLKHLSVGTGVNTRTHEAGYRKLVPEEDQSPQEAHIFL